MREISPPEYKSKIDGYAFGLRPKLEDDPENWKVVARSLFNIKSDVT